MYEALGVSFLLVLLLAVPATGFLVRTYILFHDCTHSSFLPSRRANDWLGCVLGLLVFTPFARWRREHVKHHAGAGDLDRRGSGDVPTWTVAEYETRSWRARFGYRLARNPLVLFGLGGIFVIVIQPRWAKRSEPARVRRSTWRNDAALALAIGGLCWLVGWEAFLLVEAPIILLTGVVGVWLFLVQHQFDDTYWRRSDSVELPGRGARAAAPISGSRRCCSSSAATSGCTTCTTCTRRSRTTTCSVRTTPTRSTATSRTSDRHL